MGQPRRPEHPAQAATSPFVAPNTPRRRTDGRAPVSNRTTGCGATCSWHSSGGERYKCTQSRSGCADLAIPSLTRYCFREEQFARGRGLHRINRARNRDLQRKIENHMASTTTPLNPNLESILRENRVFPPPPEFAAKAHVKSLEEYEALYKQSIEDPEAFWGGVAKELHWFEPWTRCSSGTCPGRSGLSAARSISATTASTAMPSAIKRDKAAIIWEGEPGEVRKTHLRRAPRRSAEIRQCPQVSRHQEGRPRRHLHGHDSRAGHRPARLRAHRRHPLRHLRRIRRQRPRRPHQRRAMRRHHHPGRHLPPRHEVKLKQTVDEALASLPIRQERRRLPAHRLADQRWSKAATTGGTS